MADRTAGELDAFLYRLFYVGNYRISRCFLASNVKLPEREMEFAFLASSEDMEPDAGEVVVNNAVHGVAVGDEVGISINGHDASLRVVSVIWDAVNSASEADIPYFRINGKELECLTEGSEKRDYLVEIWGAENGDAGDLAVGAGNADGLAEVCHGLRGIL